MSKELATFAAGCFWHVQLAFDEVEEVLKTEVGFMGGKVKDPSYDDVCTDSTGHAEVVHIEFDSSKISYGKILDLFWQMHNPTELNKQGPDVGSQYRSAIFYHNSKQKELAEQSKDKEQQKYEQPIVTQIIPASVFYPAEKYHQKYLKKNAKKTC